MTTPPARRVGLSIRNSPRQQLLKTVNFKTGTAAAATTAAATTTTTTTEKPTTTAKAKTTTATAKPTAAAQKSDPKPRGGRSQQLKIPEPIPEDIFAPPLASSDVEDDDDGDGDGKTVGKEEAGLEPNEQVRVYPDSSDEEAPPRGAISATKFTSSSQKGGRQSLRTKIASQLAGEPDEVEPGTKKRKRLFGTSKENGSPKKNASHLTNSQGFVKKQKVKASYGGRRSINSQESRKPKGLCHHRYEYRSAMINASQSQKNLHCPNFASQSQKNPRCPYFDLPNLVLSSRSERAPNLSYQTLTTFRPPSNDVNLVNDCCTFIMATTATLTRTTTTRAAAVTKTVITKVIPTAKTMATTIVMLRLSINRNLPPRISSLEKTNQRENEDKTHWRV